MRTEFTVTIIDDGYGQLITHVQSPAGPVKCHLHPENEIPVRSGERWHIRIVEASPVWLFRPIAKVQKYRKRVSRSSFAEEMQEIAELRNGDEENAHRYADALMCRTLRSLGFGEGVDVFEAITKWYS